MKRILLSAIFFVSLLGQAQVKNYYPSANQWDAKSPTSFQIDSNKLNLAIQFAKDNESKNSKNLWLTQAIQFGKEPFSDPIGPMASRGPASGLIIYKGYIIASWGDPNAVEMVNSVTKSFVSTVVGLAVEKGLIHSIDDKVYPYLPPIQVVQNGVLAPQNPIEQTSFLYPFETVHNRKISWDHLLRQTSDWEDIQPR